MPKHTAEYIYPSLFGNLAIIVITLDPWLCVLAFRQVCYYRMEI